MTKGQHSDSPCGESVAPKEHLVLVHSFPTNSILLDGLAEFLRDHFVVHAVDLPGFSRASPPLEDRPLTLDHFARFLEQELERLALEEYVLAGVSFGFLVVNRARPFGRCKAILAMEPFLGAESLRIPRWQRRVLGTLLRATLKLDLSERLYRSSWCRSYLGRRTSPDRVEILLREIDARTFFETAVMILEYEAPVVFRDLPYVLYLNPEDTTLDFDLVGRVFREGAADLVVVENAVEHYPEDLTKQYFVDRVPLEGIQATKRKILLHSSGSGPALSVLSSAPGSPPSARRADPLPGLLDRKALTA